MTTTRNFLAYNMKIVKLMGGGGNKNGNKNSVKGSIEGGSPDWGKESDF